MVKFNFWNFKHSLDNLFFELVNFLLKIVFAIKKIFGKYDFMKKNSRLKNIYENDRVFIVGNGPSINTQDLKQLKNEITFFVNRSFKHPEYALIQPTYHVFVDPKLASGEWEIDMLDEILKKNPNVIFLLNSKWFYLEKFQPYIKNKNFNIFWLDTSLFFTPYYRNRTIDITKRTYGAAVLGQAIFSSIYMGSKKIYILGAESTGFCHELLKQDSHFYGVNPENLQKDIEDVYKDLYFNYIYIKNLFYLSNYTQEQDYEIINCTNGGILDMFKREKFEDLF